MADKFRKKLFCVPMGILKSKTRSWTVPELLLITVLLLLLMRIVFIFY